MSDKLGWFPFYPRDWYSDPDLAVVSPAIRGIWIDLLSAMFIKGQDSITGDRWSLGRLARCDEDDIDEFIVAAKCYNFCDVTECNGEVTTYTITSRRFQRESKSRADTRERVRRYRSKDSDVSSSNEAVTTKDRISTSVSVSNSKSVSNSLPNLFPEFWKVYPRKDGKQPAVVAFKKLSADEQSLAIADVPLRVSANWAGRDHDKLPHAATYLHQRRWEDDLTPARGSPERERLSPGMEQLKRIHGEFANGSSAGSANTREGQGQLVSPAGGPGDRRGMG